MRCQQPALVGVHADQCHPPRNGALLAQVRNPRPGRVRGEYDRNLLAEVIASAGHHNGVPVGPSLRSVLPDALRSGKGRCTARRCSALRGLSIEKREPFSSREPAAAAPILCVIRQLAGRNLLLFTPAEQSKPRGWFSVQGHAENQAGAPEATLLVLDILEASMSHADAEFDCILRFLGVRVSSQAPGPEDGIWKNRRVT
ncbi:hypothetical protein PG993_002533 [Apiospora rasikravindrae]|uniref:Uncharacterized protein n=1 Tax=Apiospora rasikravindrae TaxID=990691 RepID=A0ABR1TWZ1_9PEZI